MYSKIFRYLSLFLIVSLIAPSCVTNHENDPEELGKIAPVKSFDADVSIQWYKLFLEVDRFSPGYRPPAAARMLGYIGLAAYEAAVPGMTEYKSLDDLYPELNVPAIEKNKEYHWPTVLNATYYHLFKKFYPNVAPIYTQRMDELEKRFEVLNGLKIAKDIMDRSKDRGIRVADEFYRWSATDDLGHNGFKNPQPNDYNPPKGPGKWQPTAPDFSKALFPYWGKVRPFALTKNELLGKPFEYWVGEFSEDPKSPMYIQAMEVYTMTTPQVFNRQWIGEFWSDDIFEQTFEPSARWISVANQVIQAENTNLETSIFLFAKLGMAMADAAIAIWNTKYTYNVERPVSYINRLIDPDWKPSLDNHVNGLKGITPPFPAYPSGHSGFGGAAAKVLNSVYGEDYGMTDKSHELRTEFNGVPRTFESFNEMAEENALSRLYLGVHFRMDADEGLDLGEKAAKKVNALPWKK